MDDNEFWIKFWAVAVVGFLLTILVVAGCKYQITAKYIEGGYEQEAPTGLGDGLWQKRTNN